MTHAPKPLVGWKKQYSKFMYLFVVISQIWLLLQLIEIYRTRKSEGVSLVAFSLLAAGHVVWIIYAFFVMQPRNYIMALGSALALVLALGIVVGILLYP